MKIKTTIGIPDDQISKVEFLANGRTIGTVTNPPFNMVWAVNPPDNPVDIAFGAIAFQINGTQSASPLVPVHYSETAPVVTILKMRSPQDQSVFATGETITFAAEVIASGGDAGPVEFFVDRLSVGIVQNPGPLTRATPPSSIFLTNLGKGEHRFNVRYLGTSMDFCDCNRKTNKISVVDLGLASPLVLSNGHVQLDLVTAFIGRETILQSSDSFLEWTNISTNVPAANHSTVEDPTPLMEHRFYRAVISL